MGFREEISGGVFRKETWGVSNYELHAGPLHSLSLTFSFTELIRDSPFFNFNSLFSIFCMGVFAVFRTGRNERLCGVGGGECPGTMPKKVLRFRGRFNAAGPDNF